jgi:hypothetical protein
MLDNTRAAYRVLNPYGFFSDDDTLYQEGAEIYFDGEPNDQLELLTEIAKQRLVTHLEMLEEKGRLAAEKAGRAYAGRPRTLDGALAIATAIQKAEMGVMGTKDKQTSTQTIEGNQVDDSGLSAVKRGRGRPRKDVAA